MKKLTFAFLCLALFLAACATQPTQDVPEQPVVPEPEPAPEPEPEPVIPDEDSQEVESGLDKVFGAPDDEQVITAEDVLCWREDNTVSFRFRNLDQKSWQLNQDVPFPPPSDLGSVRITLNSYEVNGRRDVLYQGDVMFREPGQSFSERCGGVEVLAPGEEVTCTITPVPLKTETEGFVGGGVNELRINGPGADGIARFTC